MRGFFDLESLWDKGAGELRPKVSPAAHIVIDDTVRKVLGSRQLFWLTLVAALAIWRLSSSASVPRAIARFAGSPSGRSSAR